MGQNFVTAGQQGQTKKLPRLHALISECHHNPTPGGFIILSSNGSLYQANTPFARRLLSLQTSKPSFQSLLQVVGTWPRATGHHLTGTGATLAHENWIVAALTPTLPSVTALWYHLVDATAVAMADRLRATRTSSLGSLTFSIDSEAGLAFAF